MATESMKILLTCKDIRKDLQRLRSLIRDAGWIEDEILIKTDTVIYNYEQSAYEKFIEEKENAKTNIIRKSTGGY